MKGWNYTPDVPLQVSPLYTWPPRPKAALLWIWHSWFLISERLLIVGIAAISLVYFQPPLEVSKTFAWGWVAQMYLRNLVLMAVVAGGLHLYFYVWRGQGKTRQYDARLLMKKGSSIYLFRPSA